VRRALYTSASVHAGVILWVALGGIVRESDPVKFEMTEVNIISEAEFQAMFSQPATLDAAVTPEVLQPAPDIDTPAPSQAEEASPEVENPRPVVDRGPDVAGLQTPPLGDEGVNPDKIPTPRAAPRIAPTPAPAPAPDVETAPDVVEQPANDTAGDTPANEVTRTAPDEAATKIVTEVEDSGAGNAIPFASVRPTSRPSPPAPVEIAPAPLVTPEDTPAADPMAEAIATAVVEATSAPGTAPTAPIGPPLTAGQRDKFRRAVQRCWNLGALSSEALQTTVEVSVKMARNGRPENSSIRLLETTGGSQTAVRQAFEAARRAIIRCGANGYDLPEESYDHWQSVEMIFNPEGMRLR